MNNFQQLLFHTIPPSLDQYNLFWSYMGAKAAPRAPKLGYFNGRANWGPTECPGQPQNASRRRDRPYTYTWALPFWFFNIAKNWLCAYLILSKSQPEWRGSKPSAINPLLAIRTSSKYSQFHKTLPKSGFEMYWISVRFNLMKWMLYEIYIWTGFKLIKIQG